ncbi:hypothetical protein BRC21_00845, partial [Candidatus Saccharibacteria bacterium SW_7_54_9]
SLARLCTRYGLKPGLLCFEPRTLPEHFFQEYPTLRGARVDHPFRSHRPRYTLAQDHPATRRHYRQLMKNLMEEVPSLEYISIWSNDSGAGFEHTSSLYVGRNGGPYMIREWRSHEPEATPWLWIRINAEGKGEILASAASFLLAVPSLLMSGFTSEQAAKVEEGFFLYPSFDQSRSHKDYVLTQEARMARKFDREQYLHTLAKNGVTHVEVNGLASSFPHEPGVPGEFYNQFYTYCAGLNQFVDTPLTRGIYPHEYLSANLDNLKSLARLCTRYGLKPGLLCFEPRTLPEHFFQEYPTGCRGGGWKECRPVPPATARRSIAGKPGL